MLTLALFFAQMTPSHSPSETYYVVFLRPDPARKPISKEEGERIQKNHMANIMSMADHGILVAAGPFEDKPTTITGVFIFRVSSLQDAQQIASADPTVQAHRNIVEVHAWRGPKGIGEEYVRLHKEKPETPEGMGIQPLFLIYHGPGWSPSAQTDGHARYLAQLRAEGKVAMFGPTEGRDELVGIIVFNRVPDEEAQRLISADAAIAANQLRAEFHHWWCAEHVLPN
ncbi:MAG TPA: YciI family protein [Bryobacteraceae bacterium]|nr:YciI family protein [Bryobacteraceae bacterium]